MEKLLQHYNFDKIHRNGNMLRACCAIHGGNNPSAFVVNEDTGLWFCHTGDCGGGDAYTLVQKMENIGFAESVLWLSNFFGVNVDNMKFTEKKRHKTLPDLKKLSSIVERKKPSVFTPFYIPDEIRPVTKFRSFALSTLQHFNLGYVKTASLISKTNNPYTIHNRLAFPIMFNNMQVGISFRRIKASDIPKWLHQPAHLEVGKLLYNYDAICSASSIVVSEGITDVWAWYEVGIPAVATFGAHITNEQYRLLLNTGADLVFAFDGDDAGRVATRKALDMFKYKANTSIINFSDSEDPESIPREELLNYYKRRV